MYNKLIYIIKLAIKTTKANDDKEKAEIAEESSELPVVLSVESVAETLSTIQLDPFEKIRKNS